MGRRQKIQKALSSLFAHHLHSDKSKRVRSSSRDVEKNMEKILELLNEEHGSNELLDLIKEFHKEYRDLYEHYSHLVDGLHENVHRNGGDSVSSHADESSHLSESSDGEESSAHALRRELRALEETVRSLSAENAVLKHDVDVSLRDEAAMKETIRSLCEENEALRAQNEQLVAERRAAADGTHSLELEIEKLMVDKCQLKIAVDKLEADRSSARQQAEYLNTELEHAVLENAECLRALEKAQTRVKEMETELEASHCRLAFLEDEMSSEKEAKVSAGKLEAELGELRKHLSALETANGDMRRTNSRMEKQLEETRSEMSSLKKQIIAGEGMKILASGCAASIGDMNAVEERLMQKLADQEARLDHVRDSCSQLIKSFRRLTGDYEQSSAKLAQLVAMEEGHGRGIKQLEAKNAETASKLRRLEADKASANRDGARLQAQVHDIEAQLQLAKQKLKVTEGESKEKEDRYTVLVSAAVGRAQELDAVVGELHDRVGSMERQLARVNEGTRTAVADLCGRFDDVEALFDQKFAGFAARLADCAGDLGAMRGKFEEELTAKQELTSRNAELLAAMASSKAETLMKITALEKTIAAKDSEIAARAREKRDAIGQLCLAIEYHREKFLHLVSHLAATPKSTVRP